MHPIILHDLARQRIEAFEREADAHRQAALATRSPRRRPSLGRRLNAGAGWLRQALSGAAG